MIYEIPTEHKLYAHLMSVTPSREIISSYRCDMSVAERDRIIRVVEEAFNHDLKAVAERIQTLAARAVKARARIIVDQFKARSETNYVDRLALYQHMDEINFLGLYLELKGENDWKKQIITFFPGQPLRFLIKNSRHRNVVALRAFSLVEARKEFLATKSQIALEVMTDEQLTDEFIGYLFGMRYIVQAVRPVIIDFASIDIPEKVKA